MTKQYQATGRRKTSVARVVLTPSKKGVVYINGKEVNKYMPFLTLVQDLEQPLVVTNTKDNYKINANVLGGGFSGQVGAIRLGIARALIMINPDWKSLLKEKQLLTRDARKVERKKYGYKKARRSPQFSKR